MRIILCALVLLGCGPGRSTFARAPGASPTFNRAASEAKAVEIADAAIAAAGGAQRWAAVKQLRWTQQVTHEGKEVIAGEQAWDRWNGRHYARARRGEKEDVVVIHPVFDTTGTAYLDDHVAMHRLEQGSEEYIATARERWEFD